jgi:hypothetical protein
MTFSKKKGVAGGVLLLILFLFSSYQLYYTAMVGMSGIRVGVRRYQEDVYSLFNSLEEGKGVMRSNLRYSAYQACYDSLKSSGWSDMTNSPKATVKVVGDASYNVLPSEEVFRAGIEKNSLDNLETYTTDEYHFMGTYNIDLPKYKSVTVKNNQDGTVDFDAKTIQKLEIKRYVGKILIGESFMELKKSLKEENIEERIVLRKDGNMVETIKTPCYDLFLQAQKKSDEMTNALNELLKIEMEELQIGMPTGKDGDCDYIVVATENAITKILDTGEIEVDDPKITDDIKKAIENSNIKVIEVKLIFSNMNKDSKNNLCILVDGTITAIIKITIEGPIDGTFPVWNGKELAFEPLKIEFLVYGEYTSKPA